jgi:hypothetical protein
LLSSPCDLFSLGVLAVRLLLANGKSNLPVILDEVQSFTRHLGKETTDKTDFLPILKTAVEKDDHLYNLISPQSLTETGGRAEQARARIHLDLWLETMSLVLRLFPGAGAHSYCRNLGDVSPLALETVFDRPLQELENLLLRLRTVLVPSLFANDEIANAILEELRGA